MFCGVTVVTLLSLTALCFLEVDWFSQDSGNHDIPSYHRNLGENSCAALPFLKFPDEQEMNEGEHAYTLGQADIRCWIQNHAEQMWTLVTMCNSTGDVPKLVRGQRAKKQHQAGDMDT
ncbi:hypothetical protein ARMGADRAFT_1040552 [Armillaria gallica]|uniref:Uncharacterized protein n=1 Tax=Armillaria gallica TaxID=47427 RepID=A0A2H3CUJ4_ARMGA|nr:hypothetical protein ARMGADRAFT_1040552 [Armillaria gallica]